jgi:cob(I)alamin adenosyltransferase
MLYTGKGDDGTTTLFGCDQRIAKTSAIAEALGVLDETNALLGLVKVRAGEAEALPGKRFADLLDAAQQDLFVIQAEVAGADKHMTMERVAAIEAIIAEAEATLPPIHSFFVSGGTELAASLDHARTVARRAERRVIAAREMDGTLEKTPLMAYVNRLSSLLYALARLANHRAGKEEETPRY